MIKRKIFFERLASQAINLCTIFVWPICVASEINVLSMHMLNYDYFIEVLSNSYSLN